MEWLNMLRRKDSNTRVAWGHQFQWTADHVTPEEYGPLKYTYDTLAEECLDILNEISPPPSSSQGTGKGSSDVSNPPPTVCGQGMGQGPKRDLFQLLKDNRSEHPKLQQLWDEVTVVPEWVDWDQIARGQEVFYRYGGAMVAGLAFQSLVGGMGSERVVETLSKTGGFNVKVARHRLFETTQHVLECTKSLASVQAPDGAGFASSLRVRLLHAAVRQRILKLSRAHPSYYSVEKNGIPINDIDCVATIATFSSSLVFASLPRHGLFLRQQEIKDYIALWRLIALYTGTPDSYFETPAKAKAIMESLLLFEVNPSPTSRILANNVIRALESAPPNYASYEFLCVQTRWMNGSALSDELGIPAPPFYYYILMGGQCLFFMALCYTNRMIPYLDRRKIAALRRIMWHIIVENKEIGLGGVTEFSFKYLPEIEKITPKGEAWEKHAVKASQTPEHRSLRTLAIAGTVAILMTWVAWGVSTWTLNRIL